ncbi:ABC transporter substrate-binding protein [Planctomycetota bacterium]
MKAIMGVVLVALCVWGSTLRAEEGVSDQEILLGQSCALSGPAQALGTGMQAGLRACFAKVNAAGGIHGRTIRLVSKDDGYEPDRAIQNTLQLVNDEKVFLIIGAVGTPTAKAAVPFIEDRQVPFFGPFTGAEFLRTPYRKYVVNVRGSYYQEMEQLATYLVEEKGLTKIACFYQNDAYGLAGLRGMQEALEKRGVAIAALGSYKRNSTAVRSALMSIRRARPEAVVMVGAYQPCAEFIKLAKKLDMAHVTYCNISFVGTEALRQALGSAGEGCIISQVVRCPWDQSIPLVEEYTEALKSYQPEAQPGFVSLEGYMVGKLFCDVARTAGETLTREGFLDTIANTETFDLGGVTLTFGDEDHQGMDEVFLSMISNGMVKPVTFGQTVAACK